MKKIMGRDLQKDLQEATDRGLVEFLITALTTCVPHVQAMPEGPGAPSDLALLLLVSEEVGKRFVKKVATEEQAASMVDAIIAAMIPADKKN